MKHLNVKKTDLKVHNFYYKWSQNERWIVFLTQHYAGIEEIYGIKADSGDLRKLSINGAFDVAPSQSPSSSRFIFASNIEIYDGKEWH